MLRSSTPAANPHAARAALRWWAEAGVDVLAADAPTPWLEPRPAGPLREAGAPRRATRAMAGAFVASAAAPTPAAAAAPLVPLVDTLDAWRAALAERHADAVAVDGTPGDGLLVLGDAPSDADVEAGRPFAGDAGALLDRMLGALGRDRRAALLANRSFWPSHSPMGADVARPWLARLIEIVAPRAVVALGAAATAGLLPAGIAPPQARGRWHDVVFGSVRVPVLPTFHPAELLRHPTRKAMAWADLVTLGTRIDP